MVVFGSIHAREYTPAELLTRMAEWLVSGYGTDPEATWLVDRLANTLKVVYGHAPCFDSRQVTGFLALLTTSVDPGALDCPKPWTPLTNDVVAPATDDLPFLYLKTRSIPSLYLIALRGPAIVVLGLLGLIGGWGYTAPPLQYKYHALGVPLVFVLMGPLMVVGSYFAITGTWSLAALVLSVPVGCLVAAILHGNEWRDIGEDSRAGITTLSSRIGKEWAHYGYVALVLGAYITLGLAVAFRLLPPATLLAILSLPFLAQVVRSAELGATGQARAIAMIDVQTARLHLAFGSLLVLGVLLSAWIHG